MFGYKTPRYNIIDQLDPLNIVLLDAKLNEKMSLLVAPPLLRSEVNALDGESPPGEGDSICTPVGKGGVKNGIHYNIAASTHTHTSCTS